MIFSTCIITTGPNEIMAANMSAYPVSPALNSGKVEGLSVFGTCLIDWHS